MPENFEEMGTYYDGLDPKVYEDMMAAMNYREVDEIARVLLQLGLDSHSEVLDVGAGTGSIGVRLARGGMKVIDAIDASANFLKALQSTGAYRTHSQGLFGVGELPKPSQAGRYDAVTACGVLVKNHFPASAVSEIVAFLKPGGVFVTALRKAYYTPGEECGYYAAIQDLLVTKTCELVRTESFKRGLPEE